MTAEHSIEVVSHAPDNRLNEDAWLVLTTVLGERIVFAAIDGATTRMTPPPLQRHLESCRSLTPAAFAACSTLRWRGISSTGCCLTCAPPCWK